MRGRYSQAALSRIDLRDNKTIDEVGKMMLREEPEADFMAS
jgi:hypothetical protein